MEEAALLESAAGGDAAALRTLLEQFGGQVWAVVDREIGARFRAAIDADDVMQITYLEAFLQMEQMTARDAASFVAWLRRIAQNNLRDAIKELERKKRPPPGRRLHAPAGKESYIALVEMLGATSATPSRQVAHQELGGVIDDALSRLPADYAQVIRLYDLEGRDIADVCTTMSRSSGAIHMLRARAHDRLRALLGTETDYFSAPA